jgi:hypothetical protein
MSGERCGGDTLIFIELQRRQYKRSQGSPSTTSTSSTTSTESTPNIQQNEFIFKNTWK